MQGDGVHSSPYLHTFNGAYGDHTNRGTHTSSNAAVWVPGEVVGFNHGAPFPHRPMQFSVGARGFVTTLGSGANIQPAVNQIAEGSANLVLPTNGSGFIYNSANLRRGDISIQYNQHHQAIPNTGVFRLLFSNEDFGVLARTSLI